MADRIVDLLETVSDKRKLITLSPASSITSMRAAVRKGNPFLHVTFENDPAELIINLKRHYVLIEDDADEKIAELKALRPTITQGMKNG